MGLVGIFPQMGGGDKWTLSRAFKADREAVGLDGGVLHSLRLKKCAYLLGKLWVIWCIFMRFYAPHKKRASEETLFLPRFW